MSFQFYFKYFLDNNYLISIRIKNNCVKVIFKRGGVYDNALSDNFVEEFATQLRCSFYKVRDEVYGQMIEFKLNENEEFTNFLLKTSFKKASVFNKQIGSVYFFKTSDSAEFSNIVHQVYSWKIPVIKSIKDLSK